MIEVTSAWWLGAMLREEQHGHVHAVTAGVGSGKSHGVAQWHDYLSRKLNHRANYSGWMEPTYQLIKTVALPTFRKVLLASRLESGRDYEIIESPPIRLIYRKTGHTIFFVSADKPHNIVGFELSHGSIDEAGVCKGESIRQFRLRVRAEAGRRQTAIFGAPQGVNDFAEEFDSDTLPNWEIVTSRRHRSLVKPYTRYIVWTDDNPFKAPEYLQSIQDTYGHNPNLIKSYRYGLFCPLVEGAAYGNYIPQKHDIIGVGPSPEREICLTWDFNAQPIAWVALQRIPFDEPSERVYRWVCLDEANEGATQLDDAVVEFAQKFPVLEYRDTLIALYGDSSGHARSHKLKGSDYQTIEKYLRDLGYRRIEIRARHSNPLETDSVEAVQKLFLKNLLCLLQGKTPKLKKSLLATTWKEGARKLDKPAKEKWTHHSDALKYFCYAETLDETGKRKKKSQGIGW